jgi:hypothetical protein
LRTKPDKAGKQYERGNSVQYDQKGYAATCVSITLPFEEKGIDADFFSDIDLFS